MQVMQDDELVTVGGVWYGGWEGSVCDARTVHTGRTPACVLGGVSFTLLGGKSKYTRSSLTACTGSGS